MTNDATSMLGACLIQSGRYEEAEALVLEAYAGVRNNPAVPDDRKRDILARIVELYDRSGNGAKAGEYRAMLSSEEPREESESKPSGEGQASRSGRSADER